MEESVMSTLHVPITGNLHCRKWWACYSYFACRKAFPLSFFEVLLSHNLRCHGNGANLACEAKTCMCFSSYNVRSQEYRSVFLNFR